MNPRRAVPVMLGAAAAGAALLGVGLRLDPVRAWFSYLLAWTVGVGICVGALLLLMVGYAAKASWMVVIRRVTESIVGALPVQAALFVPICFGLARIYPWVSHPDDHMRRYLNAPFFIVRSAAYLGVFVTMGSLLCRWSRNNDARPSMRTLRRLRALSAGGLPLVGLTTTWASFDWIMSLQPEWTSTVFGLYFFAGAFTGALALVSLMTSQVRLQSGALMTPDHAQALGRLLFAMICVWAYMAFSQLLVYWIGDIPVEITFYELRTTGSWAVVTCILVVGHFVVPFFALLHRRWKRHATYLAGVALWLLVMHVVDVYWLVLPVHDRAGARPHWLDLGALLFVAGVSGASIARRYLGAPPLPLHDPALAEGLGYEAAV